MTTLGRSHAARVAALALLTTTLAACEDPGDPYARGASPCGAVNPPILLGTPDRVLTDVALEVQIKGIVMKITVEDPNGTEAFATVTQQMEVFQDPACRTATLRARNQVAAVNTPVTFGTIVREEYYPDLYREIAAAHYWPVRVHFVDVEGNGIEARVRARVLDRIDD